MISFSNPNFYEKIIKKYDRRIRKSYFPNLFFKRDFKSSVQGNTRIFFSIKLNFYRTIFHKNFSLSSHKEKQLGYSVILPEFKFFSINLSDSVNEKSISSKLKPKKNEQLSLINRLALSRFLSINYMSPEPIIFGFRALNPLSLQIINHKITILNLQLSNLTLFYAAGHKYTYKYLNNSFANSTSPKLKLVTLKLFENNSWMPLIKIKDLFLRSKFKIMGNCKNLFLKGNSLFFAHSSLPTVNEIIFRKDGFASDYSALPLVYTPAASSFFRKALSDLLRKVEKLKLSSFGVLFRGVSAKKLHSGNTGYRTSEKLLEILIRPYYPENLNKKLMIRNSVGGNNQLSKHSVSERPKLIEKYDLIEGKIEQKPEELTTSINIHKREYKKAGNFLHRGSGNLLNRENRSLQVNKEQGTPTVSRIIQWISSDFILLTITNFAAEMKWKNFFSSIHMPEKKPEDEKNTFKSISFKSRDLQSFKNYSKFILHPKSRNTWFTQLSLREESGKSPINASFLTSRKDRYELTHIEGDIHKIGREDLVYGTSQTLTDNMKEIKKLVFETKETLADHLESHFQQVTRKSGQVMDIEEMSEKIMQTINRRLKIEAERRGIF